MSQITDSEGRPLIDGAFYWVKVDYDDRWRVAELMLWNDDDAAWYLTASDYPSEISEIGARIMPPNL